MSPFDQLKQVYNSLCTIYTFLSARRHVVPTVDMLLSTVENQLSRKISLCELGQIQFLLPQDVFFGYIDINQTLKEEQTTVEDVYEIDKEAAAQRRQHLLVFEFLDGELKPQPSKKRKMLTDMSAPQFSIDQMKKMIDKRKQKFLDAVQKAVNTYGGAENAMKVVEVEAESLIPVEPAFVNPLDTMGQEQNDDGDNARPSIAQIIREIKQSDEDYHNQIVENGEHTFDPRPAVYSEFVGSKAVLDALEEKKGITKLYSHQAEAIRAIQNGENVILSTSTSSGKSLIYQIPVLEMLSEKANKAETEVGTSTSGTAIYIFPTKALAQDQKRSLQELLSLVNPSAIVDTFDGDTPKAIRAEIRDSARVIFTNPDMIHANILPTWKLWAPFLRDLKIVVVDELHVYNGLFGANVSMVMRRLRRVCAALGNHAVQFVSCSATIQNPKVMMQQVFGIDQVTLVDQDGSPHGMRHVVLWNTPYVSPNDPTSGRVNPISEAAYLFLKLVSKGVRTIAFCRVRKSCELLMKSLRQRIEHSGSHDIYHDLEQRIMSYRGGYSAEDRRRIEQEMFTGGLTGIVATNALELGIDIGNLDAVIVVGFPFTISSFRQQIGRAGRRHDKDSLALLIGGGGAVDQYYLSHPNEVFDSPNVQVALELDNPLLVEGHLQCAAFEIPIDLECDRDYFPNLDNLVERLTSVDGSIANTNNTYTTHDRFLPWPSDHVAIRGAEEEKFAVVDVTNSRNIVIEQVEGSRAIFTLYEGGIFLHQGQPYLIQSFEPDNKLARVQRVNVDWITRQRDFTDIDPIVTEQKLALPGKTHRSKDYYALFGRVRTTAVVFGFFKVDSRDRILDRVEVDNPPYTFDSQGFWIDIPKKTLNLLRDKQLSAAGAIHAAEHAILNLMPRVVSVMPNEMGTECKAKEKEFSKRATLRQRPARLIFYDRQSGSGITSKAFEFIGQLIHDAVNRVNECPCSIGCPECVCSESCKEDSVVVSKIGAKIILGELTGQPLDPDSIPMGPEPNLTEVTIETVVDATVVHESTVHN